MCPSMYQRRLLLNVVHLLKTWQHELRTSTIVKSTSDGVRSRNHMSTRLEMKYYFENRGLQDILIKIPNKFLRKNGFAYQCILFDPKIARKIGLVVSSRMSGKYVLQCDVGFDFMSEILVHFASFLRLCEVHPEFRPNLEEFQAKYPDKVDIFDINFHKLVVLWRSNELTSIDTLEKFFQGIPQNPWDSSIYVTFVCAVLERITLGRYFKQLLEDERLKKVGRSEYFILMPASVYKYLNARPNDESDQYTAETVFFRIMFDSELLLNGLPRKVFLPWPGRKSSNEDDLDFIMVWAAPKVDLFDHFTDKAHLSAFIEFISENIVKTRRVVPTLESYVPNCGIDIICDFNVTTFTEFIDLSPDEIFSLFLYLSKKPEFVNSSLFAPRELVVKNECDSFEKIEEVR